MIPRRAYPVLVEIGLTRRVCAPSPLWPGVVFLKENWSAWWLHWWCYRTRVSWCL